MLDQFVVEHRSRSAWTILLVQMIYNKTLSQFALTFEICNTERDQGNFVGHSFSRNEDFQLHKGQHSTALHTFSIFPTWSLVPIAFGTGIEFAKVGRTSSHMFDRNTSYLVNQLLA